MALLLAVYGWFLITRLAKRREAYDLYSSVLSLLEQLDTDGRRAWKNRPEFLDEYTERKLLSKTAFLEQRLELIWKHYSLPTVQTEVTTDALSDLRILLTAPPNSLTLKESRSKESRSVAINHLTSTLTRILLEENYTYINQPRWWLPTP